MNQKTSEHRKIATQKYRNIEKLQFLYKNRHESEFLRKSIRFLFLLNIGITSFSFVLCYYVNINALAYQRFY